MRNFVLLAATVALITAGVDGCSRRPRPLRPHKEPHALAQDQAATSGWNGRHLAQNAGPAGQTPQPER